MGIIGRSRTTAGLVLGAFVASLVAVIALASPAAAQAAPTIAVTAVDPAAGTIELTNYGDAEADPNGIILCNFPAYAAIEDAPAIAPGASITIDSAAHGVALDPSGGEMGHYLTPSYEDPTQIISYVEWGEPGHQRAPVAIQAGIWADGVADASSGVLTASTDNPTSPADWAGAAEGAADDGGADEELAQTGTETVLLAVIGVALVLGGVGVWQTGRRAMRELRA